MPKLCLSLGLLSCAIILMNTVVQAAPSIDPDGLAAAQSEIESLLKQIEHAETTGDIQSCDMLQPIPLFEGAPSVDDWRTLCVARVTAEEKICGSISAMIVPDLKSFCSKS